MVAHHIDDVVHIATMDLDNESYEFNELGIFYHEDTKTYWRAVDAGCSCPVPWDDFALSEDAGHGPFTGREVLWQLDELCMEHDNHDKGWFVDSYRRVRALVQAHILAHK